MQTIFEIFDPVSGVTEGFMDATARDRYLKRMDAGGYVRDYLPAGAEGFYVVNMRGNVKTDAYSDRRDAQRFADFENMGSDSDSFAVVDHRL